MITRKQLTEFLSGQISAYLPPMNTHYADETTYSVKDYNCIVTFKALSGDIEAGVMNYPINLYVEVDELYFDDTLQGVYNFVTDFCDNKKRYTYTDPIDKETLSVYFNATTPYVPQAKIPSGTVKKNQIIVQIQLSTVDNTIIIFDDTKQVNFIGLEYLSYTDGSDTCTTGLFPGYSTTKFTKATKNVLCDNLLNATLTTTKQFQSYQKKDNLILENKVQNVSATFRIEFVVQNDNLAHLSLINNAFENKTYTIKYDDGTRVIKTLTCRLVEVSEIGQRGSAQMASAQFIVDGVAYSWQ